MSVSTAGGRVISVSVNRSTACTANASARARSGTPSAPTPGVDDQPQVQAPMPLSHAKRLAQPRDRPGHTHTPDEGHAPPTAAPPVGTEARRQLLQPQAPAVLCRRLAPEPRVDMLGVDRLLQPRQLPTKVARPPEAPLQRRRMEPVAAPWALCRPGPAPVGPGPSSTPRGTTGPRPSPGTGEREYKRRHRQRPTAAQMALTDRPARRSVMAR